MQNLKLTVAYDGTGYGGWQLQVERPSIQGELQKAIEIVLRERVAVTGSGRTDAGVHAAGQVASCRIAHPMSPETLLRALNSRLPRDIRIVDVVRVRDDFHAIRHSIRKRYRYRIWNGPVGDVFLRNSSWHVPRRLRVGPIREALSRLLGQRDFVAFQSAGSPRKSTVRTLTAADLIVTPFVVANRFREDDGPEDELARSAAIFDFELEADGFLYNMARNVVGTMVEVGLGRRPPDSIDALLASGDRKQAGMTAPPQGLTLLQVWCDPRFESVDTERG